MKVLSRDNGFTLVEVIVALAIMSLVMLATVTGFRTLGNTAGTINTMTARVDELRSVSSFLRDAFENAVVGSESGGSSGLSFGGSGADMKPSAYFSIKQGDLAWRSKILFGEAYGGSYFLRLERRGDELRLQWQEPNGRIEPGDWRDSPGRTVLEAVELFEVWHRVAPAAPWVKADIEGEPPSHVKLVIKSNGRFWPELVMEVRR